MLRTTVIIIIIAIADWDTLTEQSIEGEILALHLEIVI